MSIPAMLAYLSIMSITPGPNNLMCLYLGARRGLRGASVFIASSNISLLAKSLLCGLLNIVLAEKIPAVVPYLKWLGAAYMLYLAYNMVRSGMSGGELEVSGGGGTVKDGILLQCLNIKSWVASLSYFSVYVVPYTTRFTDIFFASLAFFVIAAVASVIWCCFGVALQGVYRRYKLPVSIVLALSLTLCAVTALR